MAANTQRVAGDGFHPALQWPERTSAREVFHHVARLIKLGGKPFRRFQILRAMRGNPDARELRVRLQTQFMEPIRDGFA